MQKILWDTGASGGSFQPSKAWHVFGRKNLPRSLRWTVHPVVIGVVFSIALHILFIAGFLVLRARVLAAFATSEKTAAVSYDVEFVSQDLSGILSARDELIFPALRSIQIPRLDPSVVPID